MLRTCVRAVILIITSLLLLNPAIAQEGDIQKDRIQALYDYHEKECIKKGWKRISVSIRGLERKTLWKGPKQSWKQGAIIALHGGGGTYSNFGSNIPLGKPMVEFGDLALKAGFAIFALESTSGMVTDDEGRSCGKRWDCIAQDNRENIDLPFIDTVIMKVIPKLRPAGSAEAIFITGISNGGFMTILAATHFADKITAFAPVSAGDPYGTYMDMGTHPLFERQNAPGVFRDNETHKLVSQKGAAAARAYPHEKKWPELNTGEKPAFKQFHHQGDGACDISCMKKARYLLVKHEYRDDGPFILEDRGRRTVWKHFWRREYNQSLIEFFTKYAPKTRKNPFKIELKEKKTSNKSLQRALLRGFAAL